MLDVDDPELVWPGHEGSITLQRASRDHLMGYVRDEVLRDYQGRPIFEIHPMSGAVSYRGQWAVSFCHRMGRGHIALELKKLYEGNPPAVIEHWHRYAVSGKVAQEDRDRNGNANIAERAKALVQAFLRLTWAVAQLGDALGLSFSQRDVGAFDTAAVEYRGWWTFPELGRLSDVVSLNIPVGEFLERAKDIAVMLELLQEAPMRNVVLTTGLTKKQLGETGTIKLLGTLSQLATTCKKSGHHWPADVDQVVAGWDKDLRLGAMARLYSLNQLRQKDAHRTGDGFAESLAKDLKAFGIDPAAHAAGWSDAVDAMFDGLIGDLNEIADLLAVS
ncbi:hypothetical protein [Roseateles sp.]|uniref:hypothetical protein n=1 Tax=Roseateles sp. TaxID=1971397 RepID=UPI003D132EE2